MTLHIAFLLGTSLAIALATSVIRQDNPRIIASETTRFFATIVLCLVIFGLVVVALEEVFLRR